MLNQPVMYFSAYLINQEYECQRVLGHLPTDCSSLSPSTYFENLHILQVHEIAHSELLGY